MRRIGSGVIAAFAAASLIAAAAPAKAAAAVIGAGSYGQELVTRLMAVHPRAASMRLYVTLPGAGTPESIASSDGHVGEAPSAAVAEALATWRAHFVYDRGSHELHADVPMLDMSHKKAGVMQLVLHGRNEPALEKEAFAIRNQLARRTSYAANLVQAAVDDPSIPLDSYAQHLVDEELAKHRDVLIIAIHATTPRSADPEILASNIGRIGKKADDDDMRVVRDGKTNLEVNRELGRYEVELPLLSAAGARIGALGVVFPLTARTNRKAKHLEAIRIRNEIARQIPSAAKLVEPYT